VAAVNQAVVDSPEVVNTDPYGEGWLLELAPAEPDPLAGLLDATGYRKLTDA
jgi:glycine cleavage system H protein